MRKIVVFLCCFISLHTQAQNFSLNFDGSTQYVNIPDQSSIDLAANFTIEGWINPAGTGSDATQGGIIINKENSYEIARYADGSLQFALSATGLGNDWYWTNTGLVAPLNTWSHFAMVKSGTTVTIYLNAANSFSSTSNPSTLTANSQSLRIGARTNNPQYFNGAIDEVRIWNTTRTLAQIKTTIFNRNLSNAATGLVAYYRMNEGSGTTTANSCSNSTGIDGTLVNTPTWTTSPIQFAGNALSFDGNNDIVTIAQDNSLNISTAITLEAWVYATKNIGIQDVICKSSGSVNTGYIFPRTDDGWAHVIGYLYIGGGWQTFSAVYPSLNAWHHLALTYDGATVSLYIDGVLAYSRAQTGTIATNSNALLLGNQAGGTEYLGGYADEMRIWNIARTQLQIQNSMNVELDPTTQTGLVSYYTADQGIATGTNTGLTTLIDQKSNNNGTLSSFALSGATSNYVVQQSGISILPVTWLGFTAQKKESSVLLNWSTATEENTRDFAVLQSINGSSWKSIGIVAAAGNSGIAQSYSFTDNNPAKGINYYRIQLHDLDDRVSYSSVASVFYSTVAGKIIAYPNPVKDGTLNLQLPEAETIFMYSSTGELILSKQLPAGTQQLYIGRVAKGVYHLKAGSETIRIVVQ